MASHNDDTGAPALSRLQHLKATATGQLARAWVNDAKFHSLGFKDSNKFFFETYIHFNSSKEPLLSRAWQRTTPPETEGGQDGPAGYTKLPGLAAANETDPRFQVRKKSHEDDVKTHNNLLYALITKLPEHMARTVRDPAYAEQFINVQDLCEYVIKTFDKTQGVSTQDTWLQQYTKLKNKDRKKPSEFMKYFNEQQRLAITFQEATSSYKDEAVRKYRDGDLLILTMQGYRSNLPLVDSRNEATDRFLQFRNNINVSINDSKFNTYQELENDLRQIYLIWANDVTQSGNPDITEEPEEPPTGNKKRRRPVDNPPLPSGNKKVKIDLCPLHPNGRHSKDECRNIVSAKPKLEINKANKPWENKRKPVAIPKPRITANHIKFNGCKYCKTAGRTWENHNGFNCHYLNDKRCSSCQVVDDHLRSCSKSNEISDLSSIFSNNVKISKDQEIVNHSDQDLMDILFESGDSPIPGIIKSPIVPNKEQNQNLKVDSDELLDYDEIEINKNNSNYLSLINSNQISINNVTIEELVIKNDNFGKYVTIGIIDSGCPIHMTPFINLFRKSTYKDIKQGELKISLATTDSETYALGRGQANIRMNDGRLLELNNTLFVPDLHQTLIAPQVLINEFNLPIQLTSDSVQLMLPQRPLTIAKIENNYWKMNHYSKNNQNDTKDIIVSSLSFKTLPLTQEQYEYLHVILGHPGEFILNKLLTKGLIKTGIKEYDNLAEKLQETQNESIELQVGNIIIRKCLICDTAKCRSHTIEKKTKNPATSINERIGTDLAGPVRTEGFRKERYIMNIVDYYTKYLTIHCLNTKDQWTDTLITSLKLRVNKHDKKIKAIRTDNAELRENKAIAWFEDDGILPEFIPPGVDHKGMGGGYERYFQTLFTMITASLIQARLPPKFWSLAAYHNTQLKNIWFNKTIKTSPYIMEEKKIPNISQLHPFGCFTIVKNSDDNKISADGDPGIYVGNKATNLYLIYNIKTRKILESTHVTFYNNFFPGLKTTDILDLQRLMKTPSDQLSDKEKEEIILIFGEDFSLSHEKDLLTPDDLEDKDQDGRNLRSHNKNTIRRTNEQKQNKQIHFRNTDSNESEEEEDNMAVHLFPLNDDSDSDNVDEAPSGVNTVKPMQSIGNRYPLLDIPLLEQQIPINELPPVPRSQKEAMSRPDAELWRKAEEKEHKAFFEKWKVGTPVAPEEINPKERIIPSKLVYAYKDHENILKDYKARIVGRGDLMTKDQYEDTFSPVVRIRTQRVLIAISESKGLKTRQFDCDNAYLQGKSKRKILIRLPGNWEIKTINGVLTKIVRLDKSLYGMKESGREWYETMRDSFLDDGYTICDSDPCVFFKVLDDGMLCIVSIYVDDGLQLCRDGESMRKEYERLQTKFTISGYRDADYLLSISKETFDGGTVIHQSNYVKSILEDMEMWDDDKMKNSRPTPMAVNYQYNDKLTRLDKKQNTHYRSLVMKLSYLAQQTRADIMYAVNVLAQYQEKPTIGEWKALIHILRYLKGTWDFGLYYRKAKTPKLTIMTNEEVFPIEDEPHGFADASFANETNRKSRSGYVFFMSGAIVSWMSKKQPVISVSSTEAELYSLSEGVREAIWIRKFLNEIQFGTTKPTIIEQDNKSTIAIAKNPIHHQRVKHIDIKLNHMRQYLDKQELVLRWCATEDMIADILTKALPAPQHQRFTRLMGYVSVSELRNNSTKSNVQT